MFLISSSSFGLPPFPVPLPLVPFVNHVLRFWFVTPPFVLDFFHFFFFSFFPFLIGYHWYSLLGLSLNACPGRQTLETLVSFPSFGPPFSEPIRPRVFFWGMPFPVSGGFFEDFLGFSFAPHPLRSRSRLRFSGNLSYLFSVVSALITFSPTSTFFFLSPFLVPLRCQFPIPSATLCFELLWATAYRYQDLHLRLFFFFSPLLLPSFFLP